MTTTAITTEQIANQCRVIDEAVNNGEAVITKRAEWYGNYAAPHVEVVIDNATMRIFAAGCAGEMAELTWGSYKTEVRPSVACPAALEAARKAW